MGFRKVNKENAAKAGGGNFITESGLYDVTINAVTLEKNDNGAESLGFYVNLGVDNNQMIYGGLPLELFDKSGEIEANVATLDRMATVAGLDEISDPVEATLPIGKDGADKDVEILEDFCDLECKLWVKFEYYTKKDGSIGEKKLIKNVFSAEGASADEIINETEVGVKLSKQEPYFTSAKYGTQKSPLTKEDVDAWIAAGRTGGATVGGSSAGAEPKRKFGGKFGKK